MFNPIALRKVKIVYNFDLSECNMVLDFLSATGLRCMGTSPFFPRETTSKLSVYFPGQLNLQKRPSLLIRNLLLGEQFFPF